MYLSYYGLEREPFHITPDPDFLFLTESHKQALGSLIYGIEKRKGFVVITGPIGVGKTTTVRFYLERWRNPHLKAIYIFNPSMTFGQIVKTVSYELGLQPKSDDVHEMLRDLHAALVAHYQSGTNIALIIDEAQNLPVETLENLRLLSNLETAKDKLLQIVFIGQSEFEENLDRDEMRQLRQRVAIRTSIGRLSDEESLSYIQHRLSKAGLEDGEVFSKAALKRIAREAKGIPRVLNILCDNALVTGFGYQVRPVTGKVAQEVISDLRGTREAASRLRPAFSISLLAALVLGAGYLIAAPPDFLSFHHLFAKPTVEQGQPARVQEKAIPVPVPAATLKDDSDAANKPENIVRVLERGNNLTWLTKEVYGITDRELRDGTLMELIRKTNPQIVNLDKIPVGTEILFPPLSLKGLKSKEG